LDKALTQPQQAKFFACMLSGNYDISHSRTFHKMDYSQPLIIFSKLVACATVVMYVLQSTLSGAAEQQGGGGYTE
jgi:hypothetical protein